MNPTAQWLGNTLLDLRSKGKLTAGSGSKAVDMAQRMVADRQRLDALVTLARRLEFAARLAEKLIGKEQFPAASLDVDRIIGELRNAAEIRDQQQAVGGLDDAVRLQAGESLR